MTFQLAPRWALSAQAIDGVGDPHLKPGVHLKVMPSHHLGLPITPFIVYRYKLGASATLGGTRSDITWVDSRGITLHTPFNVTADNPVTGYLPLAGGEVCCWIDVDATPSRPIPPVHPVPPVRPPRLIRLPGRGLRPPVVGRVPRPVDIVAADLLDVVRPRGSLRVDATVATSRGMAVVASSLGPDYQLAFTPIQQVRITGNGRVDGVRWVSVLKLEHPQEVWRVLALPVPSGHRYAGIADAEARANERVARGAPVRLGLHDRPDAATPGVAPAATDADEAARIASGRPVLDTWLDKLLNDMSAEPEDLRSPVTFNPGPTAGTLQVPCLGALLQASLDPGVGRWLGYGDRDEAPLGAPGDVVVYVIRALFNFDKKHLGPLASQVKPIKLAAALAGLNIPLETRGLSITDDVLDLGTLVCATIGNPPLRLPAPTIGTACSPLATPPSTVPEAWLPRTPPDAAREMIVPLSQLGPGACVALARRTPAGITGMNRRTPEGRAITLVSTASPSSTTPGEMTFRDGVAPPDAFFYRGAQADWFGRWSGWSENAAAAGVRPPPPRPTVLATYAQPTIPEPMPTGPLAGTFRVEVPVPVPGALTPGGHLIKSATITIGATSTTVEVVDPAAPNDGEITALISGPAIERAGTRVVTVTARFLDTAGTSGGESTPITLVCRDPRPPEEVSLPRTLLYASRPDATGLSRVSVRWTAAAGQASYRIFYADELRLGSALDKVGTGTDARAVRAREIRAAFNAASDAPNRAAVLMSNRTFFDRGMFEQLTETPLASTGAGSAMQFDHAVSGSLRVLSLYRVVAVSASQVESPFAASGIAVYAVPNTGPPPQPLLAVVPDPDAPIGLNRARLTISVPRGLVKATEYRLRRSTRKSAEPHEMMTVATGAFVSRPTSRPEDPEVMTLTDVGTSGTGAGLRAWTQYQWIVEVRGESEKGGGPSAAWSTASAKASILFVPPTPPIAPVISGAKVGADFQVSWTVADKLAGGHVGDYKLELYRRKPGEHERVIKVISADATVAAGGRGGDIAAEYRYLDPAPPLDTTYRVIVRDPVGRTSPPTPTVVVEEP